MTYVTEIKKKERNFDTIGFTTNFQVSKETSHGDYN